MLSKTQAQEKINQIHHENNGITSTQDIEARLETYYPATELTTSKHHTKRLSQCSQYFQALELLKNGGAYLDVARPLKVHHSQIQRWIDGQRPDYIELARRIPKKKLGENEQWLPLIMEGSFHPTAFIRVPITVNDWSQIQEVIRQLKPLDSSQLNQWKLQFGDITQEDAFAYLVGMIVSDANKQKIGFTSTYIELRLSKKYEWSKQVGEATCYYFGLLGISAERGKDRDSSAGKNTCYSWVSRSSPFITWITKSCLGLEPEERTTYSPIKAQWMLRTPKAVRKKFLQGLNDGDGWASIKDQVLGNACQPNIDFYKQLLQTFDIDSRDDKMRVKISRQESIIRAAQIPFFLHASERQKAAEKLEEMMQVRRNENPVFIPQDVINAVFDLYSKGHSTGAIAEIIFDNFRVSYDRRRILYILKKYG
jgi:hypothetical protein